MLDVSPCGDDECLRCTATTLTLGTCLPGTYVLQYSVADEDGNRVQAFWDVYVESRNVTTLDLTIAGNTTLEETQVHFAVIAMM